MKLPSLLHSFIKNIELTKSDTMAIIATITICFTIILSSILKNNEIRLFLLSDGSSDVNIRYICADN